ncbi:MAG: kinase/pyrophosphorylase [Acidiferrobacterales bacterium]|nr:kinase/pyrophosphorylase [Acidiferrobacterales bacterium]
MKYSSIGETLSNTSPDTSDTRPVFIISDRSGLTAETLCHTLLSQFPQNDFNQIALPFVDSPEKVADAVQRINSAAEETGNRPLVFTTFVDEDFSAVLRESSGEIFDVFSPFIGAMERVLGQQSSHQPGQSHGISDLTQYTQRINAVNYALYCDDGLHIRDYDKADIILLAASRSGKTPTCLYLALQFGFYAANYPLTDEDFEKDTLPEAVLAHKDRLFGLVIDPRRLHQIRSERRPDSRYASLSQCQRDVSAARAMFERFSLPYCDSTNYSVEELGSTIKHQLSMRSPQY